MDTKKLRQKILDLAIHGKLVPQDPNDEPASVLLERIRAEKEQLIKEGKIKKSKKSVKTSDTPHYEQVPFEVPEGWVWTTLGDILSVKSGDSLSVRQLDNKGIIPVYGGNGITGRHNISNTNGQSIVIGRVGYYCGSIHLTEEKSWVTDNAFIVSFSESNLDIRWLAYTLNALQLGNYSNSTAQPVISGKTIYPISLLLPPLAEQQRIVAEIEKWFALVDIIEQGKDDLQATIAQAKSKILDLAIHGKLVPQDSNDEPAIELLRRINPKFTPCDNGQYGNIPSSWTCCRLSDVANSELGKTLDREKNTGSLHPYLCSINILWNRIDLSVVKEMRIEDSELTKYEVNNGDLLICEGGESGRCAIWDKDTIIYYQNALHRVRFFDNISAKFFMYQLDYMARSRKLDKYTKGVTIKHLTKTALNSIPFVFPPIQEQQRIVIAIEKIYKNIDTIQSSISAQ